MLLRPQTATARRARECFLSAATFNCYFNKEADSCDAPVCSR